MKGGRCPPLDGASCYASSARETDLGEWLGPIGVKAMEDAAACYASLGACMKHHDEQAEVRKRHARETYAVIKVMDKDAMMQGLDYENDLRTFNLQ